MFFRISNRKMPFRTDDSPAASALREALDRAIRHAAGQGYTRFLSGMSTGFDLWAAEAVLRTRAQLPVQLYARSCLMGRRPAMQRNGSAGSIVACSRRTGYTPCHGSIIPAAMPHATSSWWTRPPC